MPQTLDSESESFFPIAHAFQDFHSQAHQQTAFVAGDFLYQEGMPWTWLVCLSSCLLLLGVWCPAEGAGGIGSQPNPEPELESEEPDQGEWELGSGTLLLQELLHSFPADSPFVTETPGKPANCTQRYWLPSSTPVCWDNIAGPEEFEHSRLLVLQNRATLQAVSQSSGVVEEGASSYNQQAQEDLQGVRADHLSVAETTETMQKVFLTLAEKRREGKENSAFTSIKEHLANTRDSISGKEHNAALLERQFTSLEKSLYIMQHRLNKLMMK